MNYYELLETKRRHVKIYNNKVPPKSIIANALWKAWKTSPSKNNAMAYQALVWGPDKILEKEAIHSLCVESHKGAEERGVKRRLATITQKGKPNPYYEHIKLNPYLITIHSLCVESHKGAEERGVKRRLATITQKGKPNPYYEHIKLNPYLITIHSRVSKPNRYYEEKIKEGHFYDQGFEKYIELIIDSVSVEVGLFLANLTVYLLEAGLDISYNSCFVREVEGWHKVGLNYVKTRPISMITCGYAERYRRQDLKESGKEVWDIKPDVNDIIKWI